MDGMRTLIYEEISAIRKGLSSSESIDYDQSVTEFVSPYALKVGDDTITSFQNRSVTPSESQSIHRWSKTYLTK